MAHRDDHEAARHRVAALERDLADARAEAERARRDADDARARRDAEDASARADRPRAASPKRQKKKKRARARADERSAPEVDPRWRPGARAQLARGAAWLGGLAYGGAALAQLATSPADGALVLGTGAAAVVVMPVGAFVLGRVLRAPEPFGGALVTLLLSPMILGVVAAACTDDMWPDLPPPGPVRLVMRIVVVLIALAFGVAASRSWITDAASSPIQPD